MPFKLSVLVPVFNERFLVAASLDRVLAFRHPMVSELEVLVVDDGSTDGTRAILADMAARHPQIHYFPQESNRGKGAALRVAIQAASGDLCVIHDADMEYDPQDWARLLRPFVESNADAVYGSRFMTSDYRRVLYYRHTLGNQFLTAFSNLMTDLNLTDVETCYKMVRTSLLKSIPIRSDDFGFEIEITAKLAKRGAVIFEVPIRYSGRTYAEGKKITWKHGAKAIGEIAHWSVMDDIYAQDEYGTAFLNSLTQVRRINRWMADSFAEHVGSTVLEIGAGMGNLTLQFLPRERYVATDVNEAYLRFLSNFAIGKPYMEVQHLDLASERDFAPLAGQFDTVLCLNVLEHMAQEDQALRNILTALKPGGKTVLVVPQGPWLHSSLDRVLGHVKRYRADDLVDAVERAGLNVSKVGQFNKTGVLGWFVNGNVLRRTRFSPVQLKFFNSGIPLLRHVDPFLPWKGLSLILIARKPAP